MYTSFTGLMEQSTINDRKKWRKKISTRTNEIESTNKIFIPINGIRQIHLENRREKKYKVAALMTEWNGMRFIYTNHFYHALPKAFSFWRNNVYCRNSSVYAKINVFQDLIYNSDSN